MSDAELDNVVGGSGIECIAFFESTKVYGDGTANSYIAVEKIYDGVSTAFLFHPISADQLIDEIRSLQS